MRSKDSLSAKGHPQTPMSERQQMALLLQMSASESLPKSPGGTSYSYSRHRDRNERGETLLHLAAIKGDIEQTVKLLAQRADPNIADFAGWTPLHEACNYGWYEIANKLVQAGANVNAKGLDNDTPLHDAVANGHLNIVKLLIDNGADIHSKNSKAISPLDLAGPNIKPYILNPALPIPESMVPSRLPSRGRDDKKMTESGGKAAKSSSNNDENSDQSKSEDVYEFKSKEQTGDQKTTSEIENSASESTQGAAGSEDSNKRTATEMNENSEENSNEEESRKKKRKEETGKEKIVARGTAQGKGAAGKNSAAGGGKNSNLSASKTAATSEKKSPSPSPKVSSDPEDEAKSDLKVPPLKIVIPQTGGAEHQDGATSGTTSRTSKNSSQRAHHQALPYVVPISNESNSGTTSASGSASDKETAVSVSNADDVAAKSEEKKDGGASSAAPSEEQRGGSHQRVLRSSHKSQCASDKGGDNGTNNASSSSPQRSHPPSPSEPAPAANAAGSGGSSDGVASKSSSPDSQTGNETEHAPVVAPTSVPSSTSSSSLSSSTTTVSTSNVDLHPRKRKMKPNKEAPAVPVDPPDAPSESQVHPHEQPITNCYKLYLDIRKQIQKRRKGLFPVQPKPPQGFKDYLMNRCTYVLSGRTSTTPNISYPPNLPPQMKDTFTDQEKDRYQLRMRHVIEKEKLVLSVEQEILRVHGRAARALANQSLPFSVCSILRDEEVYNLITPEQEEKDRNARSRYNGRLFLSWLQDVDDKWEKIKEHMLLRHHNEAESLYAIQKMDWEWKMKEMNLCDRKSTPSIDEHHVPMVHVSDDFDLLPA